LDEGRIILRPVYAPLPNVYIIEEPFLHSL